MAVVLRTPATNFVDTHLVASTVTSWLKVRNKIIPTWVGGACLKRMYVSVRVSARTRTSRVTLFVKNVVMYLRVNRAAWSE